MKKLQAKNNTYSPYNINIFNENFYRHANPKEIDKLPNLLSQLDLFNIALYKKIVAETNSKIIKLTELASGNKMNRWETFIQKDKTHKWEILLTDFDKPLLPSPKDIATTDNFKFSTKVYNLFNKPPLLKPKQKQDVIISSYTFDNVWLKDDLHLSKINNTWYYNLYKLENKKITTRRKKINISSLQYGTHIDKYYKDHKKVSLNFPGGLISTAINSFSNQLKNTGVFITADIATTFNENRGFKTVNKAIKIKIENYALAKYILEKLGFKVDLKNLHDFIKEAGVITPVKVYDHLVLMVYLPHLKN